MDEAVPKAETWKTSVESVISGGELVNSVVIHSMLEVALFPV